MKLYIQVYKQNWEIIIKHIYLNIKNLEIEFIKKRGY